MIGHRKRHLVHSYIREGNTVHSHMRGSGQPQKKRHWFLNPTLRKRFYREIDGVKIYTVNGAFVRKTRDISFTMGAHHYVDKFIPEDEVWIDDNLSPADLLDLIIHESVERKLMKDGMAYEPAHDKANALENYQRNEKDKSIYTPTKKKRFTRSDAVQIGKVLNIRWNMVKFHPEDLALGMGVELEHGLSEPETDVTHNEPILTGKIALAHLNEDPEYYWKLKLVESK